ncbi:MAG TPA: aminomethyl-transferring glycine dehydrogenase subunit GcvPB [Planctomycetota bacterium]|nr:aminomethyl-transferring glycine dehydrogenase subunit GcvPB [Planctomycetota bacterium]
MNTVDLTKHPANSGSPNAGDPAGGNAGAPGSHAGGGADGAHAGNAAGGGAHGSGTGVSGAPAGRVLAPAIPRPFTVFDASVAGRRGVRPPGLQGVPAVDPARVLPGHSVRKDAAALPEIGELDAMRHYTRLSSLNFSIANAFYPLGSCTMKYNPLINESAAALPGFGDLHPMQTDDQCQGMLELFWRVERWLIAVSGLPFVSLHPAAGAHGELTALMVMRKYLNQNGGRKKKVILIPDSAHGTNPASCTIAGFATRELKSTEGGAVDLADLEAKIGDGRDIAGLMITNPSTLGLFVKNIRAITDRVHKAGGLVYMDGANMNAIVGRTRPGDFGIDVMHFNLHKTFSQPHGGGGPGAGPIAVSAALGPYLPVPKVERKELKDKSGKVTGQRFVTVNRSPKSIGRTRGFMGNAGVMVRAYTYMRANGPEGLKAVADNAVLNANYIRARLHKTYRVWNDEVCMHEVVLSAKGMPNGIRALDIAKRLIDYGIHPPTIYFPLIVPEALMIEPTETESKETLDRFCDVMLAIWREAETDPELLRTAPHTRSIGRPDEVRAVKVPKVIA